MWSCWRQDPCLIYLYNPFVQHVIRHQAGNMDMIQLVLLLLFSHSVLSGSLQPHGLQHARLPCPSLSPRVCSNSCPLSLWYHPTTSSSVTTFSSCPQSFPASGTFPVSQLFESCGQSIGASASASVLPMNIQDWFPLGLTSLITLLSRGLSRVFSSTTGQKDQFFKRWFKAKKLKDACSLEGKLWQT